MQPRARKDLMYFEIHTHTAVNAIVLSLYFANQTQLLKVEDQQGKQTVVGKNPTKTELNFKDEPKISSVVLTSISNEGCWGHITIGLHYANLLM